MWLKLGLITTLDMTDHFSVLDNYLFTFVYAMSKFWMATFDTLGIEKY